MQSILIIEDDLDTQLALKTGLQHAGYSVRSADNSELGLKAVVEEKPDLIILDVFTNSLHGAAFLQRLRELPDDKNDSKVIILTNLDNAITREKVERFHVDAFLVKSSTSIDEIISRIRDLFPNAQ